MHHAHHVHNHGTTRMHNMHAMHAHAAVGSSSTRCAMRAPGPWSGPPIAIPPRPRHTMFCNWAPPPPKVVPFRPLHHAVRPKARPRQHDAPHGRAGSRSPRRPHNTQQPQRQLQRPSITRGIVQELLRQFRPIHVHNDDHVLYDDELDPPGEDDDKCDYDHNKTDHLDHGILANVQLG